MKKINKSLVLSTFLCLLSITIPSFPAKQKRDHLSPSEQSATIIEQKIEAAKKFITSHAKTIIKVATCLAIGVFAYLLTRQESPNISAIEPQQPIQDQAELQAQDAQNLLVAQQLLIDDPKSIALARQLESEQLAAEEERKREQDNLSAAVAIALEVDEKEDREIVEQRANQQTLYLPEGRLTNEARKKLKMQHTFPILQGQKSADCGIHVVVNARLIDVLISDKKYEATTIIKLSNHKQTHSKFYTKAIKNLKNRSQKTTNLGSDEMKMIIEYFKQDNIIIIENLDAPVLTYSIREKINQLIGSPAISAACHFIFNTGGHWVLFSVIKVNGQIRYYYTNSGANYRTIHPILHPYIHYIATQINPDIFKGLKEAPLVA